MAKKRKPRCYSCGSTELKAGLVVLSTTVGPTTVIDSVLAPDVCQKCGDYTLGTDELLAAELRAASALLLGRAGVTGKTLRFARKALGFTVRQLALELGVTEGTVTRWERDRRKRVSGRAPRRSRLPELGLAMLTVQKGALGRLIQPPSRPARGARGRYEIVIAEDQTAASGASSTTL